MNDKNIRLPNFFIVGAARSGTSSLGYYLGQHPDVYLSPVKEPSYFVSDFGYSDYDEYLSFFRKAGNAKAIGEASTGYLFDKPAAGTIHQRFPEAKIIIMLRNPVDIAASYWRYMLIHGSESKSFQEAISELERDYRESDQFKKTCEGWWGSYVYLDRGLYFNQVKRYLDFFGWDQVRVYIFERFIRAPESLCRDIFNFLGVDTRFVPDFKIVNEGGGLRSDFIKTLTNRKYPFLRPLLPFRLRVKIRKLLRALNTKRGEKVVIDISTRRILEKFFREDIIKLEALLRYDIPEWNPKSLIDSF